MMVAGLAVVVEDVVEDVVVVAVVVVVVVVVLCGTVGVAGFVLVVVDIVVVVVVVVFRFEGLHGSGAGHSLDEGFFSSGILHTKLYLRLHMFMSHSPPLYCIDPRKPSMANIFAHFSFHQSPCPTRAQAVKIH